MACNGSGAATDRNPFVGLALPPGTDPNIPIEYDDRRVQPSADLNLGAPFGAVVEEGVEICNDSDGSSYQANVAIAGIPGVSAPQVGTTVRMGGLSLGLFASGLVDQNLSLTPQLGIGGITVTPTGICSGFWCVGMGGPKPLPPVAMAAIAGIQLVGTALQTEREDAEAFPIVAASEIVSNVIPITPIRETLSLLGMDTGQGPQPKTIETVDELISFRNEIDRLTANGARADALSRVEEMLVHSQDPFVAAELMELRDKVLFERNRKDLPGNAIEGNIRAAVERVEDRQETRAWMASALYLARKLQFWSEPTMEDGRLVFKIRRSSPFQMRDPGLAVRLMEALAVIFRELATPESDLTKRLNEETNRLTQRLLSAVGRPYSPESSSRVMKAEAARAWHVSWLQTMGLLYTQGHYHRRLEHIRWIVSSKAEEGKKGALLERLKNLPHPEIGSLEGAVRTAVETPDMTAEEYSLLRVGIDALRKVGELSHESFPDWMGDGSLLFDPERARNWARRLEIIDGVYRMVPVLKFFMEKKGSSSPRVTRWLAQITQSAERGLVEVMKDNRAEVSREWHRYWAGFPQDLRENLVRRLEEAEEGFGEIDGEDQEFQQAIYEAKKMAQDIRTDKDRFQTDRFGSYSELFKAEMGDSEALNQLLILVNQRVLPAFERLRMTIGTTESAQDKGTQKTFQKAEERLRRTASLIERARANYERFNARRVGRYFLDHYVRRAQIDPTDIPDSMPF